MIVDELVVVSAWGSNWAILAAGPSASSEFGKGGSGSLSSDDSLSGVSSRSRERFIPSTRGCAGRFLLAEEKHLLANLK